MGRMETRILLPIACRKKDPRKCLPGRYPRGYTVKDSRLDRLIAGKGTVMKTHSFIVVVAIALVAGAWACSAQSDDILPLDDDERLIDSAGLPGEGPML